MPTAIAGWLVDEGAKRFTTRPWLLAALFLPAAIAAWLAWHIMWRKQHEFALRGRILLFVLAYVTTFAAASHNEVVLRPNAILDYELPRVSRLLPQRVARLGDWRYAFFRRPAPRSDLLVVTMKTATHDPDAVRAAVLDAILKAKEKHALGIAFDLSLEAPSEWDAEICSAIEHWSGRVYGGERHVVTGGRVNVLPMTETLRNCFEKVTHFSVLPDPDGVVRHVPIHLPGLVHREAFSWAIAEHVAHGRAIEEPPNGLVDFIAPASDAARITYEALDRNGWSDAAERFVIFGHDTPDDRHSTPYGDRLGVEIHAFAVQSLLDHRFVLRPSWMWATFTILMTCYCLMVAAVRGWSRFAIACLCAAFTVAIAIAAATAAFLADVWVEIASPATALWLFAAIVLALRRRLTAAHSPARD